MAEEILNTKESPRYLLSAFNIDYFLLENFKLISKKYQLGNEPIEITFDVKTQISFFDANKVIQSSIKVIMFLAKEKKQICKILDAEISFDFTIENYDLFKVDDKYQYPDPFLKQLNNIAISTSRGLLYEKISCTPLQGIMMPLIFSNHEPVPVNQ